MQFDVNRLMRLWDSPISDETQARAAFGDIYTDPVRINGNPVSVDAVPLGPTHRCRTRCRDGERR